MDTSPDALYTRLLGDLERSEPGTIARAFNGLQSDTPRQFACAAQAEKFLTKLLASSGTATSRRAAEREFFRCNLKCGTFQVKLGPTDHFWFETILGEIRDFFRDFLCEEDLNEGGFFADALPGPGVSLDTKDTSYASKLHRSNLGFPSEFAKAHWAAMCDSAKLGALAYARPDRWYVASSEKLSFVPKNEKTDRPIGIQTTGAICLQGAIARKIELWLMRKTGIDIKTQADRQRILVYDNTMATVDLTSASALLSSRLVAQLLPPRAYNFLSRYRSEFLTYQGKKLRMHTFSAMGNAYTFALQTAIFYAIARGVYRCLGLQVLAPTTSNDHGNLGVFGDDIIVVKPAFELLCKFLTSVGLEVNETKSFCNGPFRESCGVDVFENVDVRPVYLRSLETLQDRFILLNKLSLWYARWGIEHISALVYLVGCCREKHGFRVVPCAAPLDSGIRVPAVVMQQVVLANCSARHIAVRSPLNYTGFSMYKGYAARSGALTVGSDDSAYPTWMRGEAALDLALSGTLRDGSLAAGRPSRVKYHLAWRPFFSWDCYTPAYEIRRRPVVRQFERYRLRGGDIGEWVPLMIRSFANFVKQ
ncbi:TPA_asm: RNA-directed RNA polymerase [ssRNA phage SRR6254353_1]|uniref:RNA-directed RNA polymerase n=1 Tax=ssRNA phage SRR6254353_1 TaxID=2786493 RepID=A0A8S5L4T3_9VIRU|nr:RNA-directed RNA polymerase [ssRNA phage SRR6254353_1]DAD52547.1 TPA_asm: RNA-directed RNA polymerase [ssRNA phage SRR6254353_1]